MAKIARPSVASLFIDMRWQGKSLATGTAFTIFNRDARFLITNRHNLSGQKPDGEPMSRHGVLPDTIVVMCNTKQLGTWAPREFSVRDVDEKPLWIEHPSLGADCDVVALPLSSDLEIEWFDYEISQVSSPTDPILDPSSEVSIVGFPFGLTGGGLAAIWSRGTIATEPATNFQGAPMFLVDSRTRPGQSGSPVIFYQNGGVIRQQDGGTGMIMGPRTKLLGVYSGRINELSDLGMVWKISVIADIVAGASR